MPTNGRNEQGKRTYAYRIDSHPEGFTWDAWYVDTGETIVWSKDFFPTQAIAIKNMMRIVPPQMTDN